MGEMMAMTDLQKLRILLPHWIEHNVEHAAEFREWAERARVAGQEGAASDIALAAEELEWANEELAAALEKLGQG